MSVRDEALIARLDDPYPHSSKCFCDYCERREEAIRETGKRLSLRSGQLAQVLALCDERDLASAESRKYGGAFCYAQVLTTDEIRNLLTTEEQER